MSAWDLTFLGTGSAYPSPHRGASCTVLRTDAGCWVFDCGEGSQIQLMRSSIKPGRITKIFITHLHGDHMFGLPGLLCTLSSAISESSPPLEIFGPVGVRQFVRMSLNLARSQLDYSYVVHELQHDVSTAAYDGMTEWCPSHEATGQPHFRELPGRNITRNEGGYWEVCRDGSLTVTAGLLKHRIACFGYVITEDPLPGKLQAEKLKQLGVPPGPLYARLKNGDTIETPHGIKISPSDVVGPARPGRKVVVLGDTCDSCGIVDIAKDADVLVHEATNENSHELKCRENGHSTPGMAAAFCHQIGAKQLILTHFSQRYRKSGDEVQEGEETVDKLVSEATQVLETLHNPHPLSVDISAAEDFKSYTIRSKKLPIMF